MVSISKPVGQGGINLPNDVETIQRLLNRNLHLLRGTKPFAEDHAIGPKTIAGIRDFQHRVMKMPAPDGLVSPGGPTFRQLVAAARPVRPVNVAAFIGKVLAAATKVKSTYGVPISVLMAQAALESGWGSRVKDNAYFGIKGKSTTGSTSFVTTEFVNGKKITTTDTFRAYKDFGEAASDYGAFLTGNPRYAKCFAVKNDPFAFADQLQTAGYATDPQYATKLKSIIRTYYLDDYDR